jgi:hypothetical protein
LNNFRCLIDSVRIVVCSVLLLSPTGCLTASPLAVQEFRNEAPAAFATHGSASTSFSPNDHLADGFSGSMPLTTAHPVPVHVLANQVRDRTPLVSTGDSSYENVTLTEDITWRGTVLIRGYLVVAPQATVRIEPGTEVRFMKSPILRQLPSLVVMGRLQCNGTADKPILFAPNFSDAARGDWGGILLLSSEKRNQFDNIRIEGAETGIEARFSTLIVKGAQFARTATGMLLHDSTATLSGVVINGSETGLEAQDSEIEMKDSTLEQNRRAIVARHATLVLVAVSVRDSVQQGITTDECRIRFNACELAGNSGGARLNGGEGHIFRTRFVHNRESALQLVGARLKINQSLFADTSGDGIRMDDGRSVIWGSVFTGNSGYNLSNAGREEISAVQNWWGSNREADITAKLFDASAAAGIGRIRISPWLSEKPVALP